MPHGWMTGESILLPDWTPVAVHRPSSAAINAIHGCGAHGAQVQRYENILASQHGCQDCKFCSCWEKVNVQYDLAGRVGCHIWREGMLHH